MSRNRLLNSLAALLATIMATANVQAAVTDEAVKYGTGEGLPDNNINCVRQDRQGFIWVASKSGVSRFDGVRFQTHQLEGSKANTLYVDDDGHLWIGCDSGLFFLDSPFGIPRRYETDTKYNVTISSPVTDICQGENGDVLVATNGQGLFIIGKASGTLTQNSAYATMLSVLLPLPDGNILVGGEEGLVFSISPKGDFLRQIYNDKSNSDIRNTIVSSLHITDDGHIFAGFGNKGIMSIDPDGEVRHITSSDPRIPNPIQANAIITLNTGYALLGTSRGLAMMNVDTETITQAANERNEPKLDRFFVNDIFVDNNKGYWISTRNDGLYYFPERRVHFTEYLSSSSDGSLGEIVTALTEGPDGNIYVGTEEGFVYCLGVNDKKPRRIPMDLTDVLCLFPEKDLLWIGTTYDGLYRYNLTTGKLTNFRHDRNDINSISDNRVNTVFRDKGGKLYVGTEWGLNYFNGKKESFRLESKSGNMVSVSKIMEDSHGSTWIMTHNSGLTKVNDKQLRKIPFKDPITGNNGPPEYLDAIEDTEGGIWFATSRGLLKYDYSEDRISCPEFEGVSSKNANLYAIEKDNYGNIWATGPQGIYCFNIDKNAVTEVFSFDNESFGNHFIEKSSAKGTDGTLYFGGTDGINAFDPSSVRKNEIPSPLYITGLQVNNKETKVKDGLKFERTQDNITLEYSLLSYGTSRRNQYKYYLEGYDSDWSEPTNETSVKYSYLKPGKYRFHLVATNGSDFLDNRNTSFEFTVKRSPMASVPALLLYISLLIGLTVLCVRLARRIKESKEISSKLDLLTDVTHELRTSVTLIKTPLSKIIKSGDGTEQTKQYLSMIGKGIDNLMENLNHTLDYRKTQETDWQIEKRPCDLEVIVGESAAKFRLLAQAEGKSLEFNHTGEKLYHDVDPDVIAKIMNNLLSNAVKYASSVIKVDLDTNESGFSVQVFNDGKEIEKDEREKIFNVFYQSQGSQAGTGIGLALVKKLTEKHGGNVRAISMSDGACFRLEIPTTSREKDIMATAPESKEKEIAIDTPQDEERFSILVVDDNVDLRMMIAEILKERFDVYHAGDGKTALKVLEETAIDLILSDIIMPKMDGIELCRTLKSDKRFSHVPLILLSAKATVEDKLSGLQCGADDYIEKPFSPDYLVAKVSSTLDNRRKLMAFYGDLPAVHPKKIATFSKEDMAFIEKLNAALDSNIKNNQFHIGDIAGEMFLSQSTLYRRIKSLFDLSPNDYVKQFRLQKAADMLSHGENTVNYVCFECGFNSISYFSSCFKKKYGMSPTQYLTSIKEKADKTASKA